jgi:hypothetical protein
MPETATPTKLDPETLVEAAIGAHHLRDYEQAAVHLDGLEQAAIEGFSFGRFIFAIRCVSREIASQLRGQELDHHGIEGDLDELALLVRLDRGAADDPAVRAIIYGGDGA